MFRQKFPLLFAEPGSGGGGGEDVVVEVRVHVCEVSMPKFSPVKSDPAILLILVKSREDKCHCKKKIYHQSNVSHFVSGSLCEQVSAVDVQKAITASLSSKSRKKIIEAEGKYLDDLVMILNNMICSKLYEFSVQRLR